MKAVSRRAIVAVALGCACVSLVACSGNPEKAKSKYLEEGKNYMKKGQYGDAAIEFRNALRIDPRFVDAYFQLAQADLAQHNWDAAYASLEKAIDLDPTRLDARLDRGQLYLAARQFANAEAEANSILKQQPGDVGAYQLLGTALIGEKKPDQALAAFEKLTELRPNDASAYINLALVEISLHHSADAERYLMKALSVNPKSIQAYTDLANFYRLQKRIPEAQATLQKGVATVPDGTSLYIELASMLANQGKSGDVETVLDNLRKQLPNSSDAAVAIGDFYFVRKQMDQALAEYRRGLSVAPKNLGIKKRMQDLYLETNQIALANDLDKELMKDAPKDVFVRIDHGRLLMAQGKTQDAVSYLQGVVADAASSAQAHYYLAVAFWQNGNLGQARSAFMDSLKISQSSAALQALARLSVAQGNIADAQIYAQEIVQRAPADVAAHELLAGTLARQGKLQPAEQQILLAEQLAPDESAIHVKLGQIYAAEKKWPEAQKEFELALQLDPHSTSALAQLADFLMARNQANQALARVRQYTAANPNDANAHVVLGSVNLQLKDYGAAQAEFEHAIQIDPNNIQAHVDLVRFSRRRGRPNLRSHAIKKRSPCNRNSPRSQRQLVICISTNKNLRQLASIMRRHFHPTQISLPQSPTRLGLMRRKARILTRLSAWRREPNRSSLKSLPSPTRWRG